MKSLACDLISTEINLLRLGFLLLICSVQIHCHLLFFWWRELLLKFADGKKQSFWQCNMTSQWTHDTKYVGTVYQRTTNMRMLLNYWNIVLISGGTSVKTFMPKEFGWQKGLGNPDLGHAYQTYRPHQGVQFGLFAEKY